MIYGILLSTECKLFPSFSAGSFLTRPSYTLEPRGSPIVTTANTPENTVTGYSSA